MATKILAALACSRLPRPPSDGRRVSLHQERSRWAITFSQLICWFGGRRRSMFRRCRQETPAMKTTDMDTPVWLKLLCRWLERHAAVEEEVGRLRAQRGRDELRAHKAGAIAWYFSQP